MFFFIEFRIIEVFDFIRASLRRCLARIPNQVFREDIVETVNLPETESLNHFYHNCEPQSSVLKIKNYTLSVNSRKLV